MPTTMLRLPEVKKMTGLSRSTIYALIAEGKFPRQIALAARAAGWVEEDVQNWIMSKINLSRSQKLKN